MPLIAVVHSPFCPLDKPSQELYYFCDLMNLPRGMEIHHHEALLLIVENTSSIPVFNPEGEILTMSLSQWSEHLQLLQNRILCPGETLSLPTSKVGGRRV